MNLACNRKWWPLGAGASIAFTVFWAGSRSMDPWLTYDNHFIKPPKTPEQGYHNVPDLNGQGQGVIADLKQWRPMSLLHVLLPGACHRRPHTLQGLDRKIKACSMRGGTITAKKPWPTNSKWESARPGPSCRRTIRGCGMVQVVQGKKEVYAHEMEVYAAIFPTWKSAYSSCPIFFQEGTNWRYVIT